MKNWLLHFLWNVEQYHKLEFLTYFYREGGENRGTLLSVSLQPVVQMRQKGWTKFFAGTSVTHGDCVPALIKGDEISLSEGLSSSWKLERASFANLFAIFLMSLSPASW